MYIMRWTVLISLWVLPSFAYSRVMADEPQRSLRAYIDSAHIEGPSTNKYQQFGASFVFKNPITLTYSVERRFSYGLDLSLDRDYVKKSGEVSINQDFYSLSPFLEINYVNLFRFSALAGPGLLMSLTRYNILNEEGHHSRFTYLAKSGIAIDYAFSSRWEFSWHLLWQYRFHYKKWDWRQGVGLVYNF